MRPGFGAELRRRLLTAAVALSAIWALLFRGPALLVVATVALCLAIGLHEFHGLLAARGIVPFRLAGFVVLGAGFVSALPLPLGFDPWPAAVAVLLVAVLTRPVDIGIPAAAATLLAGAWLGSLGGTLAALRIIAPVESGAWRIVLLLAIVMGSDTAAYFTGSAFGRRKLAPAISPGKTVEGSVGGVGGGIVGALVVRALGLPDVPLAHAVGLGAAGAVVATAGDLAESALKRWAGVKDSGRIFPGHGGMLDRLDSLLLAAPVLYHYFLAR